MKQTDSYEPMQENRLLLSMQMVFDDLDEVVLSCEAQCLDETPCLQNVQIYSPGMQLEGGILYFLPPSSYVSFPVDDYPFVTTDPAIGNAPHISSVEYDAMELLNLLLQIFERYHTFEASLNALVAKGCDLDEICRLGYSFFNNPMYIHDQYFSVLSHPAWLQGMLQMEYNEKTERYNIPLNLIEDFKFSEQYLETLKKREASIWDIDQYPLGMRSLYVNLRDGEEYIGRLLINEINTPLQKGQFKAAEYLASRIVYTMQRHRQQGGYGYRSHEETVRMFLQRQSVDQADIAVIRTALSWNDTDHYLCLCMEAQMEDNPIFTESALRSRITSIFHNSISFFHQKQLCFVINLTASACNASDVRHLLSPIVRDSLMYCGMSDPIERFDDLPFAWLQAKAAMEYCDRWKDARWIMPFETCAAAYMKDHIRADLPEEFLVSHALRTLLAYDRKKGTEYYHTLKVYLQNERDVPRTSQLLIIHRTTLQYRLEKITKIIKLHLDNEQERLYLLISFALMEKTEH